MAVQVARHGQTHRTEAEEADLERRRREGACVFGMLCRGGWGHGRHRCEIGTPQTIADRLSLRLAAPGSLGTLLAHLVHRRLGGTPGGGELGVAQVTALAVGQFFIKPL